MNYLVEISVIIPTYNDRESLELLFDKIMKVMNKIDYKFELIFIDDGSNDNSIGILKKLKSKDNRLKIIIFDRNYGMHSALFAGFKYASGKLIVTIDGDLQTDPEQLPLLLQEINKGCDIVSGWRRYRRDYFFLRVLPSVILNLIFSCLIGKRLHDLCCTFKIYRRDVVQDIIHSGNLLAFTPQLRKYNYSEVKINHRPRLFGKSKFSHLFLIKQAYLMLLYIIRARLHNFYIARPLYKISEIYD